MNKKMFERANVKCAEYVEAKAADDLKGHPAIIHRAPGEGNRDGEVHLRQGRSL